MLAQSVPTIFWYQPQTTDVNTGPQAHEQALVTAGFTVRVFSRVAELYQSAIEALALFNTNQSVIFLISGGSNESLAALARLRSQYAQLPIVVALPEFNESQILQALYCGADQYCLQNTSTDLWAAVFSSLLRRSKSAHEKHMTVRLNTPTGATQAASSWKLQDEGWLLTCPEGQQISLTTTERQLLQILFAQPDKRASHQQLLDAISNGDESDEMAVSLNRLGVVISRLKRKAQRANMTIPIRSVYKWGYMFGATAQKM